MPAVASAKLKFPCTGSSGDGVTVATASAGGTCSDCGDDGAGSRAIGAISVGAREASIEVGVLAAGATAALLGVWGSAGLQETKSQRPITLRPSKRAKTLPSSCMPLSEHKGDASLLVSLAPLEAAVVRALLLWRRMQQQPPQAIVKAACDVSSRCQSGATPRTTQGQARINGSAQLWHVLRSVRHA